MTTDLTPQQPKWTPIAVTPIATVEQYEQYCDALKRAKAYQRSVAEFFGPHKRRVDEQKRALLADERRALLPAQQFEAQVKVALVEWDREQERQRKAEERRLRELARQDEERRRLDEAAALEREGVATDRPELILEAEDLINAPIDTPTVIVESNAPKVSGIAYRDVWRFRIVDASRIPREYLIPDEVKIGGVVRALKGGTQIDGVEVYSDRVAAAGTR